MPAPLLSILLHLFADVPAAAGGMEPALRPYAVLPAEPREGEPLRLAFLTDPCETVVAEPGYPRWGLEDDAVVVTVALMRAPASACDFLPGLGEIALLAPAAGTYRLDIRRRVRNEAVPDVIARGRLHVLPRPPWWERPAGRTAFAVGAAALLWRAWRRRQRRPLLPGWAALRDWWAIPLLDEWLEPERLPPPPRSAAAAFRRQVRRGVQNS